MNELLNSKKKSEVLVEQIVKLQYGDIISHNQISTIIEEEYPSNKYTSTIAKAKKILLIKGICLENIIGDGYRLLAPDNFVNQSLRHYKRGFVQMKKGYDTLEYAPTRDMTPEGLDMHRKIYDRATILNAAMQGASVELKTLSKKKHPMALENIKNN